MLPSGDIAVGRTHIPMGSKQQKPWFGAYRDGNRDTPNRWGVDIRNRYLEPTEIADLEAGAAR
jgi:hypothetical protein